MSDGEDVERCECCDSRESCDCDISWVDDSDPSVGYHAEIEWCFKHDRRVG